MRRGNPIIREFIAASWISEKLDIIPHAQLVQRLEALGVPINMQWGTYALYESMSGNLWSPKG